MKSGKLHSAPLATIKKLLLGACLVGFCFAGASAASAQDGNGAVSGQVAMQSDSMSANSGEFDPLYDVSIDQALRRMMALREIEVNPNRMNSMFFTLWQHKLLQEAKLLYIEALKNGTATEDVPTATVSPRGIRELNIGGILFNNPEKWTVWLNGQRITPDAIPPQVLDMKVYENYVELKWIDNFSNRIYPVRMQAHQRFNLDTRIFLPGVSTDKL